MNFFLFFIFFILAIIFIPYFYSSFKLIDPSKINKPDHGKFAELKNGNIFYQEFSSDNPIGQIVILVHGFSTPSIVWKGIVPYLTDVGYDVIATIMEGVFLQDQKLIIRKIFISQLF